MEQIVVFSNQSHYDDHLRPIAQKLNVPILRTMTKGPEPALVAGYGDILVARRAGRRAILLNHGAGQTYNVDHPSYSGGSSRGDVLLFLEPGPHSAEATRASNRSAKVVEVGCAKLDAGHKLKAHPRNEKPVVAVTFHWRCKVCPETNTALDHYRSALAGLVASDEWTVIGHAHPLIRDELEKIWADLGVEYVSRLDEVFDRADLLVADNTSALYEFASLGRPVLCLNAPEYRRDVHHGLRFWDAAPGLQCDRPRDLIDAVRQALADPREARAARAHALRRAYVACDGKATDRAVAAIRQTLTDLRDEPVRLTGPDGTLEVPRSIWKMTKTGILVRNLDGVPLVVDETIYHERLAALGWTIISERKTP